MKKYLAICLTVALLVLTVGCSSAPAASSSAPAPESTPAQSSQPSSSSEAAATPAPAKTFKIGYSFPTVNNEFWGNALTNMEAAAKQLGFELMSIDCNNDQAKQVNDVDSMLASGVNGLVLGPQDASVCPGIITKCKEKGIPVVVVDRWPGDDLKAGEDYLAFIGPNDEEAGYNIAMELINAGCDQIVAIGGYQNTSVGEGRKAGLDKALAENPNVKLLQYEWAGENWDDGDRVFRSMLSAHSTLNGVWCYNDSLALASVNVLKEAGKVKDVKVCGMDLLGPAIESMKAGELWFSTGGHYMQSAFGAVVVFDALNGIDYSGDPVTKLNLMNVSQDNLDKFAAKYLSGENAVDWKSYSKVYTPDGGGKFELTF